MVQANRDTAMTWGDWIVRLNLIDLCIVPAALEVLGNQAG